MARLFASFRSALAVLGITAVFSLASCSTKPASQPAAPAHADTISYWEGDGVPGSPKIVIDLSEQVARYYKDGQLVGVSQISSGSEGYGTTRGSFRVTEKDIDHRSSIYGSYVDAEGHVMDGDVDVRTDPRPPGAKFVGASMRYFMRINGGIGMHEGYLPGVPASHGCIRMPSRMAAAFYHATPLGTPVQVVGHGSEAPLRAAVPVEAHTPASGEGGVAQHHTADGTSNLKAASEEPKRGGLFRRSPKPPPVPRGTTLYLYE